MVSEDRRDHRVHGGHQDRGGRAEVSLGRRRVFLHAAGLRDVLVVAPAGACGLLEAGARPHAAEELAFRRVVRVEGGPARSPSRRPIPNTGRVPQESAQGARVRWLRTIRPRGPPSPGSTPRMHRLSTIQRVRPSPENTKSKVYLKRSTRGGPGSAGTPLQGASSEPQRRGTVSTSFSVRSWPARPLRRSPEPRRPRTTILFGGRRSCRRPRTTTRP